MNEMKRHRGRGYFATYLFPWYGGKLPPPHLHIVDYVPLEIAAEVTTHRLAVVLWQRYDRLIWWYFSHIIRPLYERGILYRKRGGANLIGIWRTLSLRPQAMRARVEQQRTDEINLLHEMNQAYMNQSVDA